MTVRFLPRRRSAPVLLAIGALVVGGLSGCSGQPGAAAVVDGREISVAELQSATADLSPYLQNVTQSSVLMVLVVAPTFDKAAVQAGVGVSRQQAVDLIEKSAKSAADSGAAPARATPFSEPAIDVIRFTIVQTNLKALPDGAAVSAAVAKQLGKLHAEVNPRYGNVDFTTGSITPLAYPWLVQATAAG